MGDRAYTTLLAWPYPGREHLPAELVEQLTRHRFLPDTDHPQEHGLWDGDGAAVVAGDSDSGGILLCVDEQANYGTAAYTDLIGALVRAEPHVYAGNEAGGDYGAGWEYHPPLGAGRTVQRRRCDQGDMSLIASDLLNPGERRPSNPGAARAPGRGARSRAGSSAGRAGRAHAQPGRLARMPRQVPPANPLRPLSQEGSAR